MKKKRLLTDRTGDLQQQMLDEQAKVLAREIDREVLWGMLTELGWHRITFDWPRTTEELEEIKLWTQKNSKGSYEVHRADYIFENEQDANWFKIRWLR